jgi:hypothetical protein
MLDIQATAQSRIPEADVQAHIEDTDLFWVSRGGQLTQRTWNELSATEKLHQVEAAERAAYVAMFHIYE